MATTLPVVAEPVRRPGGALPAYFAGLLPEGRRLGALRRAVKTSADDELTLLLAVGADAIGDVQVVPSGVRPAEVPARVAVEQLSDISFADLLVELGIRAQRVALERETRREIGLMRPPPGMYSAFTNMRPAGGRALTRRAPPPAALSVVAGRRVRGMPSATVVGVGNGGAVPPYRAASVADLARWLAGAAASERWRLVAEFLEEYRHEPPDVRPGLLAGEPLPVGDERWDVLLAGLAEHLAARDGRGAPAWAEGRVLRRFWFPFDSPAARVDAVVHAPAAFRRRGVFVAAHELDVA